MLPFVVAATIAVTPAQNGPAPVEIEAAYAQMMEGRFASRGARIPDDGIEFTIDSARFRLESGELRAMEPVLDGQVTGVVFRGKGNVTLELPDRRELENFRRVTEDPEAELLETEFESLLLRDGGGLAATIASSAPGSAEGPFERDKLALDRREIWLERRLVDADAWVARSLAGDAREWVLAEIDSPDLGWLTFEFDPLRGEELQVAKWRQDELATELWLSLDRASERGPDGRPASVGVRQMDLLHADMKIDIRSPTRRKAARSSERVQPRRARFEVELCFRPLLPELRTLSLQLDVWTEIESVRDESGAELIVLRDNVGKRDSLIDDDAWDNSVIVLFPGPLGRRERRVTFVYEGDILNYVGGRVWYPGEDDALLDQHTAELEITALPKHDLRAMGELVESSEEKGAQIQRWKIAAPVRMVTFVFSDRYHEERLANPGQPEVVVFSALGDTGKVARSLAEDVASSWRFFTDRFGPGPAAPRVLVTSINGTHGQSFEGFLELAQETFTIESNGPSELFRAHEVAHQWWGHLVAWTTYRDQWLSEALAQFSAMLFVESQVKEGPELYRELVGTLTAAAMGESKVGRFQRRFWAPINPRQWRRVGPIALGYRASTADVRQGYQIQTYYRGALVLHMVREILRETTGSDDALFEILGRFVREFRGGHASTADLERMIAARAPGEWDGFFRQWVERTEIPTWRWRWSETAADGGGHEVVLEVEQQGVPPDFRTPVPVRIDATDGSSRTAFILLDGPENRIVLPVDRPTRRVELNPDGAILARTVRR